MRLSTIAMAVGVVLAVFGLPVPGLSIVGIFIFIGGLIARLTGS